jgi:hypothetical protein
MYSHMDLQLQNDVGIMVTMEDDMTQPSTTTEASTKVLPRPKIVQGEKHRQENVA